jgi:hypothetical protein
MTNRAVIITSKAMTELLNRAGWLRGSWYIETINSFIAVGISASIYFK